MFVLFWARSPYILICLRSAKHFLSIITAKLRCFAFDGVFNLFYVFSNLLAQGLTFFLTYAIFAAVLGMLQFGYNTGVINAPGKNIENFIKDVYKERYDEDVSDEFIKNLRSVAVSIFAIGGMLGGFSGGWMANRFGRKGGLLLNNVLGVAGGSLMGFTKISRSYEILFLGRFIIGLNCGKFDWCAVMCSSAEGAFRHQAH